MAVERRCVVCDSKSQTMWPVNRNASLNCCCQLRTKGRWAEFRTRNNSNSTRTHAQSVKVNEIDRTDVWKERRPDLLEVENKIVRNKTKIVSKSREKRPASEVKIHTCCPTKRELLSWFQFRRSIVQLLVLVSFVFEQTEKRKRELIFCLFSLFLNQMVQFLTLIGKGNGGQNLFETKVMRTGPLNKCILPLFQGTVTLSPVDLNEIQTILINYFFIKKQNQN